MELRTLKREIIKKMYLSKKIYLMAHSNIDLDAYASMVGFSLIAKKFRRPVYIVIDDEKIESATSLAMLNTAKHVKIIKSSEAKTHERSLLVVLDVNKPKLMSSEDFINGFNQIIIIDHHNVTKDTLKIKNLYVDQKSTSTCEIVAELLSKFRIRIPKAIATTMLGGIALDTNNFTYKMTKKSFYYCYFLASAGADVLEAQLLLKQDLKEYVNRSKIVANTKIEGEIAIATGEKTKKYTSQDLAKTADILLSFKGIKNAFAIGKIGKKEIGISARSLNKLNAGKLMEHFGGGGSSNEAAARLENKTIKEVEKEILELLK